MQKPSYLGKIALVSIWFGMVLIQLITWIYKDTVTLTYPCNLTCVTILILVGRVLNSIIDVVY